MSRLDRKIASPVKIPKPGQKNIDKLSADKNLKNFILETVTYLVDCINDR